MLDLTYHCDAFPAIGMGHLTRALGVLGELRARGPQLRLGLAGRFSRSAHRFIELHLPEDIPIFPQTEPVPPSTVAVLDTMVAPGDLTGIDPDRVVALKRRCATVVLVSSALSVQVTEAIDVLVDHMPEVEILGAQPRRCYLGLEYAPVAPAFFEVVCTPPAQATALVVVIGGNDVQDGPGALLKLLSPEAEAAFATREMIVSPHFPEHLLAKLKSKHTQWAFRQNLPTIVPTLARARAVVCTYGNATYESLALGKPTFVFAYQTFQEQYAKVLEAYGLVVNCGLFAARNANGLASLTSEAGLEALHRKALQTPIGCGLSAIARILIEELSGAQNA